MCQGFESILGVVPAWAALALLVLLPGPARADDPSPRIVRVLDIASVWSGHPVGFDFVTRGDRQYVAFYDAERQMTIAARPRDSVTWQSVRLPSKIGWDCHNSIALAIDDEGTLHASGNMHVHPLVYFRSTRPWDITTLEPVHRMIGRDEQSCTYPNFIGGPRDELIFTYRDGRSGNGNQIFNAYDVKARSWRRLLDVPFTNGEGERNAYFHGPTRGPDGFFHLVWVWREAPDCATNHDLSYARSRDLVHWETSTGWPLTLPIRLATGEIVDPVPVHGGLINGCQKLGWDSRRRPIITYHKFDEKGRTQVYTARLEEGRWVIRQASDWDYRWDFQGGGSIVGEIALGTIAAAGLGRLQLSFRHIKEGAGRLILAEDTLMRLEQAEPVAPAWPRDLEKPESSFPGMQVHLLSRRVGTTLHVLRWETLGANRDQPRQGPLPEPSPLRLYEIAPE